MKEVAELVFIRTEETKPLCPLETKLAIYTLSFFMQFMPFFICYVLSLMFFVRLPDLLTCHSEVRNSKNSKLYRLASSIY